MRKQVNIEKTCCDVCGAETYGSKCLHCGKDFCYECEKKGLCVEYPHAVHFRGSGDGHYCVGCDAKLTKQGTDKLHQAYRAIQSLRVEADVFYEDFNCRVKTAEANLRKLQGK